MAGPAAAQSLARDLTGRRLGRYEVLTMLASGGMATVYIARAQGVAGFERLVAIKVLHPHLAHDEEFISMFLDEARLAARIRHPNAVGTLDISDTQGDGYFLVMEYVEGDHVGALLRSAAKGGERISVPVVARIVMDALAGLNAAHRLTDSSGAPLDLVHRDVSPHNILVGNDGVARITDFGVAKAQVRLSSTRDGQFKGKLSYMAPEQAASGTADQRSDLFSMGIVLWEALTGRRLFRGENNADVLNKILNPEVPPPSSFDRTLASFDGVIARALAREPDDRFQSAEEFLEAIEEAAASIGGVATPRAVSREVKRWLGEKIAAEHQAVRDAMEALGRSELVPGALPRPMESGSQPSQPQSLIRPIASDDATMGAKPSTLHEPAHEKRGLGVVVALVAGLLVMIVIGGGLAYWWLGASREDAQPSAVAPAAEPVVAPPAEPAIEPAAEAVVEQQPEPQAQPSVTAPSAGGGETVDAEAESTDEEAPEESAEPRHERRSPRRGHRRRTQRGESGGEPGNDDDVLANPYSR